ncbi:hypothetical protein F2Q68_00042068 [Brassica cretica]|uniref:Uncharacterized protein n=1 Tax=Brassica cretica TaxID=69181 RepID=A0A8S9MEB8_BRACR|nr:hypothetical protein F2Q68_00042068 [Brassica cretica]
MKSLGFSRPETHRFDPGATSQSDVPKSLSMFRATCWSDTPRSLGSSRPETRKRARSDISQRPLQVAPEAWSDFPERHRQVALTCLIRATLPERRGEVARIFIARRHENRPGATSRSDPSRSLPKPRATSRSDYWRSNRASCLLEFMFTQGPFGHFIMHVLHFQKKTYVLRLGKPLEAGYLFVLKKTTKNLGKGDLFDSLITCSTVDFYSIICIFSK